MNFAILFPGQGSQFPGMAKDLLEFPGAKALFTRAEALLGYAITEIMFAGTEEELKATKVTQPAIFLHSVAQYTVLPSRLQEQVKMMAGHSLGEFSALCCAEVLDFEACLQLVALRAEAMQEACEEQKSTMAAVLGLEDTVVEKLCAEKYAGQVVCANFNCPGQLVISGTCAGVQAISEDLKLAGAKRVVPLAVSGAFHSPLMKSAQLRLAEAIDKVEFARAKVPIYQNFSAKPSQDPAVLKENIVAQLTGAVRWTQSVQAMLADGARNFAEIGPGKVLSALVKKIATGNPSTEIQIYSPEQLANL